jgi:hypothetical protein
MHRVLSVLLAHGGTTNHCLKSTGPPGVSKGKRKKK